VNKEPERKGEKGGSFPVPAKKDDMIARLTVKSPSSVSDRRGKRGKSKMNQEKRGEGAICLLRQMPGCALQREEEKLCFMGKRDKRLN